MRSRLLIGALIFAALTAVIGAARAHPTGTRTAVNSRQIAHEYPARASMPTTGSRDGVTDPLRQHTRSVYVPAGATVKRFDIAEPAGVIRLLRITVPHRTSANLTGVIPDLAGIAIRTPRSHVPSESCQQRGEVDICTQAEEACPMPAATWRFRLQKRAGPAGQVRVEFIVGQQRARASR